ncbi:MAG TPA: hypothetical protein IAB51_07605 [Candidatus Merdivicinus excrementipullorum]|uniref:Uncharacterized protein n=1 Tax=Candidatus Merdivicinus excrementipullorum TaxID=2840867 RepID=A0A9D1FN96_9FIRM|nr:hypothetical protein [Candidatus Merdivicinus excrementipullorum]
METVCGAWSYFKCFLCGNLSWFGKSKLPRAIVQNKSLNLNDSEVKNHFDFCFRDFLLETNENLSRAPLYALVEVIFSLTILFIQINRASKTSVPF